MDTGQSQTTRYSQNILMLREQVDNTQRQVATLEGGPHSSDPHKRERVKELQGQLKTFCAKMQQMETLEGFFSATKRQIEKTQQVEDLMEKKLEEALQEQKKVIDELAHSRKSFEEIILAKDKELEVTKEEKEKARAQKEEVVTQVTEVLENELQCIICSELFVEAVILNCAHSFCSHCIKQWCKKKNECPICRQAIKSQTRCLALDNCIDSMVENLGLDFKARRKILLSERKGHFSGVLNAIMSRHIGSTLTVDRRRLRRIIAENPNWSLGLVPFLSNLCLESIVRNYEGTPIYAELRPSQRAFVQERLSTDLPLPVTANSIDDGVYWKRCCEQRWEICDVSRYGNSWKRMFFERHLENIIEQFIPETSHLKVITDAIPLCERYVKKLDISQMLPPIKEVKPGKQEEEMDLLSEADSDAALMEHFDFRNLLNKLSNLEEVHLTYWVKQCGMNFEWRMFEMAERDCETLSKALASCKVLKVVRLYESHIDDSKCKMLANTLVNHPSLTELNLSHNIIGDKGAKAVSKLLQSSKLEVLNMSDNVIRDAGANAIADALANNCPLLSLNLRINRISDEGGQAIAVALLRNKTLHHLHLGANLVTGPTAIRLSEVLAKNQTLKSINLSCNKLGVDGGKALEEAISQNSCLTQCDVRLTEVDEQSASVINQVVRTNERLERQK
ncbi:dynein regulatory complex subunit 5 isoform X2 [Entelurus aequoreus]|uniref:dynein regulatory complex subunit 5 isoform X2 n=1 Tax=Entelurus aequoreus TaxID=161455 RepID=UPI002B1D848F|nr:dynein regulatory complex subunit 5 isoform X2 [Entelurus aequoreus]